MLKKIEELKDVRTQWKRVPSTNHNGLSFPDGNAAVYISCCQEESANFQDSYVHVAKYFDRIF